MKNNITLIPHLEDIKKIREYEKEVLLETDVPVRDISHWNSGSEYKNLILSQYNAHNSVNVLDYYYSYEYNDDFKQYIISRLVRTSENKYGCVLIHNATAAICCIADYLKKHEYKKIGIIEPAYFSAYSCLQSFGLNVHKETVRLDDNGEVEFPYNNIIKASYDAVWITSPIFSTGIYFTQEQINCMNSLTQRGILLIIDESASSPNHTLTSHLYPVENLIAVFSPHKYLSINSTKFAAIICSHAVKNYMEDWIDVFIGSLPISTCIAIEHYLSSNFISCLAIHDKYIETNMNCIQELCDLFPNNYYKGTATNYITICNKSLPYVSSLDELDMHQIIKNTHVSFVPGYINGFSENWGFCYRVNLTLDTNIIKNSLGRLFSYFS